MSIANVFAQWGYIPEIQTINNKGNRTQSYPNVTKIDGSVQTLINQVNINNLEDDIRFMQNLGIRWAQSPAALQTQNWLVEKFESYGLDVTIHRFTSSEPPASGDTLQAGNVVAIKSGTEFPDQYIIISSHYDHQSGPGADDNASGTAGVIECARIISQIETKRSIMFVPFNAEESWMHGSVPFAIKCAMKDKNILGVFNLDMLGFYPATGYGDIKMYTGHFGMNQPLFEFYIQVANLYVPDVPTLRFSNDERVIASDITGFICNDYPAIYIGDVEHINIHPCYHQPCDTIGEFGGVNNMNLVEVYTQATIAAVMELANGWLPPQNFSAVSGIGKITLSWDKMPQTATYKIYKNDELLTETTSNFYIDENVVLREEYSYYVIGIHSSTHKESNRSNIDRIIFTAPLTVPYTLDLDSDLEELNYWHYDDWIVRNYMNTGLLYLSPRTANFSIMELDWFSIPDTTTNIFLTIEALNQKPATIMKSYHGFIEVTNDRKTWHKLAKNIDFKTSPATPTRLTFSLEKFIGSPFIQLRIRLGSSGINWDVGVIYLFALTIDHTLVPIKEIEKIEYFKNFQIYPNPSTGYLTVTTESEKKYSLAVYDLFGRKVYQDSTFRDGTLDLSALPKGVYFVQVSHNKHQIAKKVVIR